MVTRVINVNDWAALRAAKLSGLYHYCGRGSSYGNLYRIGLSGTREQVIALHRRDWLADPEMCMRMYNELKDGVLGCYCKPLACHCDFYAEFCDDPRNTNLLLSI
jgi:Domain of unknown function (DUF4326)